MFHIHRFPGKCRRPDPRTATASLPNRSNGALPLETGELVEKALDKARDDEVLEILPREDC